MAQSVGAVALDIVMGKNTVSGVAKQAMADVQKTFNDGTATIGNKVSAVGTACKSVGASLLPVSTAATGVIKSTADAAMSFETAMAQVATIAGDAAVSYKGNMTDMSKAILQLSGDTGMAAEDVAAATYSAISAGVDVSKSVEFVATANALAVGGFTDMSTSVDVLTTVMNAYGEKAGSAESISDKLITTQNLGKTTVDELASSMGKVIPTASAYNVSVDNLCASYVAMTKGGIATAEATTYMKSMLNELADSGSTVGKVLQDQTGKSFGQLMAEGYSLADVIDILGASVDGDKEKFAQLFGSAEAGTGALAILNGGTADFNNTLNEMGNSTGAASDAMNKMNDTSAHKMQVAMNDMKLAAIELGGAFAPVLSGIASAVGSVARAFSNLPGPVKAVIAVVLGVIAIGGPLLVVIGGIISAVGTAMTAIGAVVGILGGPVTLAIGAVIAIGTLLVANWDGIKEAASALGGWISEKWDLLKQKTSEAWGNIKQKTSETWNNVKATVSEKATSAKNAAVEKWNELKTSTSTAWNNLKTNTAEKWNSIKESVSSKASNAKTSAINAFTSMRTGISTRISNIKNTIVNGFKSAVRYITSLPSKALQWGKDMIQGIINGIKSMIGKVGDAARGVAEKITSFLHFSVPDEGPLTDYESWMPDFIQGMTNGIEANKYRLIDAVRGMAGEMTIRPVAAPALQNVGGGNAVAQTENAGSDKVLALLTQLVGSLQNMNFTVPVYLGNDLLDEQMVKANDRRTVRSGGRV